MVAICCQYGSCLETIGEEGVVVSLKTATPDAETRAVYCNAAHAAAALTRLALDRDLPIADIPRRWKVT